VAHTEGTRADSAHWSITGLWQRTSGGVSSRVSSAAGAQTSSGNSYGGPKPSVSCSDPSSAVAPNVLNKAAIVATGKAGVTINWIFTGTITRSKPT
jgi:hypothetical protein